VRATGPFGAKPLAIVIGGKSENASGQPFELQSELASLSSDSVVHIVEGANHTSLVRNEAHAAATLKVIFAVVDSVRSKRPLRSLDLGRY